MPNENPIFLDQDATEKEYTIPAGEKDKMIKVTVKIELLDEGWQFASANSVFFNGDNLYPKKTPEPKNISLDLGKNLNEAKLSVGASISRIRNGSEEPIPARVRYHLIIKAGDKILDDFDKESDTKNPSHFDSLIVFKTET
jgi:hypothetical protein